MYEPFCDRAYLVHPCHDDTIDVDDDFLEPDSLKLMDHVKVSSDGIVAVWTEDGWIEPPILEEGRYLLRGPRGRVRPYSVGRLIWSAFFGGLRLPRRGEVVRRKNPRRPWSAENIELVPQHKHLADMRARRGIKPRKGKRRAKR